MLKTAIAILSAALLLGLSGCSLFAANGIAGASGTIHFFNAAPAEASR